VNPRRRGDAGIILKVNPKKLFYNELGDRRLRKIRPQVPWGNYETPLEEKNWGALTASLPGSERQKARCQTRSIRTPRPESRKSSITEGTPGRGITDS